MNSHLKQNLAELAGVFSALRLWVNAIYCALTSWNSQLSLRDHLSLHALRSSLYVIFLVSPIFAQPQVTGERFFLEKLDIKFEPKVRFPVKKYRTQYVNRIYQAGLLKEISAGVLAELKDQGYYFARLDSQAVKVDSTFRAVQATLFFQPGKPLQLSRVAITFADTIDGAIREELEAIGAQYPGRAYTHALSSGLFREIVAVMENHGFPLARVSTAGFEFYDRPEGPWQLDLTLQVHSGDSIRLAYLRFPRQRTNLTAYLQRLLRFRPGQTYREKRIARYLQILRRQEFIKSVTSPTLARDAEGRYFLNIEFEETPATAFDGIIGYIPPPASDPEASGYFTGLVNIGIRNLFGGGRKMLVFWQKPDEFSDEFRVAYREPFLLGLPFHSEVGMNRLVRDTTYIAWQYHLRFELPLSDALSAFLDLSNRNVVPDSLASRTLRLPRTESITTETGIRWDIRDETQNPRRGVLLEIAFSLSSQKNLGPEYLLREDSLRREATIQRMRSDLSVFVPTFKRQALANHLHMEFIENRGDVLRSPDQAWFGGATTVRGYREGQFFARRVFWLNSEYRFLLSPEARFFFFSDNAFYSREFPDKVDQWLSSYGLGLRFGGPLGIVQLDYGLERGAPFREGKLHFRLINEF